MIANLAVVAAVALTAFAAPSSCESSKRTYDAYVPRDLATFLAKIPNAPAPPYIPFSKLPVPTDRVSKASLEFAKYHLDKVVLNHSLRSYYFSVYLIEAGIWPSTPGVKQLSYEEIIATAYSGSVLHDIGMANDIEKLSPETAQSSFEMRGGLVNLKFLQAEHATALQYNDAYEGTIVHTSDFSRGNSTAGVFLIHHASTIDGAGITAMPAYIKMWNNQTAVEVNKALPRQNFGGFYADKLVAEVKTHPGAFVTQQAAVIGWDFGLLRLNPWDKIY